MPLAARILDPHICPMSDGPKPHGGGTVASGEATVMIGFQPAARMGDTAACMGPPNAIAQGEPTVLIGDRPAARQGDTTVHGGKVAMGCPTVHIGSTAQAQALRTDKPFCAQCQPQPGAPEPAAADGEDSRAPRKKKKWRR